MSNFKINQGKTSIYDETANIDRKSNNVAKLPKDLGPNYKEKIYTSNPKGTLSSQAKDTASLARKKSKKNPVKVYSPEEIKVLQTKYNSLKKAIMDISLKDLSEEEIDSIYNNLVKIYDII